MKLEPCCLWLAALAWGAPGGCRKSDETPTESAKQAAAPATVEAPSFRRDILPVLVRQCADPEGCHGAEPTESIDLDLRASAAHGALVRRPAGTREGVVLVTPNDPDASFLLNKLVGPLGPYDGKLMPIDPETGVPIEPSPLPPGFIDALKQWIAAGALDN